LETEIQKAALVMKGRDQVMGGEELLEDRSRVVCEVARLCSVWAELQPDSEIFHCLEISWH